ncbi:MAG: hypothetical protein KGI27_00750 [Thaumarchaeota archaeon]|nr:hypothetical protein [Nitrososphaerota archaeon]
MKEGLTISLVAIAISVIGLVLVFFSHNSIQDNLLQFNNNDINQSSRMDALRSQIAESQQLVYKFTDDSAQMKSTISQMQATIQSMDNKISNLTGQTHSLSDRMANLENSKQKILPPRSPDVTFTPVALYDGKGNLWTSWFIKESLYYPTLYGTSCDARSVDCQVHMDAISTPSGTGIEADTIGSTVFGYWFLGYSIKYVVPDNGTVTISGNFLKNNTFTTPVSEGRSHLFVFILGEDPNVILQQNESLTSKDKDATWYARSLVFHMTPGQVFRVGIGAENNWENDYRVYVAWNGVSVSAKPAWTPLQ